MPRARAGECSGAISGPLSHGVHRQGYPSVQYELPGGAIGARVGCREVGTGLRVVKDGLAAAHLFGVGVEDRYLMTEFLERRDGRLRKAAFEADVAAGCIRLREIIRRRRPTRPQRAIVARARSPDAAVEVPMQLHDLFRNI